MEVRLTKTFSFEAAHRHPGEEGPGGRLHGHSFRAHVVVRGPVAPGTEWLTDFAEIRGAVEPVISRVDHCFLNEVEGLEAGSSSDVADWLAAEIQKTLSYEVQVVLQCREITDPEIEHLPAFESLALPERVGLKFEAAHSLPKTPKGHKCRGLHGHSYRVEAASTNPDRTRAALLKLFSRVDHRHLNDIEGLENPTAEVMCRVFWKWLEEEGVDPHCVVVCETCESSCIYHGN